jgi:hypothetical protein
MAVPEQWKAGIVHQATIRASRGLSATAVTLPTRQARANPARLCLAHGDVSAESPTITNCHSRAHGSRQTEPVWQFDRGACTEVWRSILNRAPLKQDPKIMTSYALRWDLIRCARRSGEIN